MWANVWFGALADTVNSLLVRTKCCKLFRTCLQTQMKWARKKSNRQKFLRDFGYSWNYALEDCLSRFVCVTRYSTISLIPFCRQDLVLLAIEIKAWPEFDSLARKTVITAKRKLHCKFCFVACLHFHQLSNVSINPLMRTRNFRDAKNVAVAMLWSNRDLTSWFCK